MTIDQEVAARGYQFKHGDRPLEGYTIQRAAGRGGFGEVYFAVSDSGREVALKLVLTYEQVELRGISQCMNLKSPQLVTIFDVRHGTDGRPWVIMEFVAGPSLRELLDAAPSGLGPAKAAFFLREIGKGLTYLHECGIVHRDLKPGNIFYENGYVKIGDYGLSKAMSMTRHSGQTVAVGTLHYMAPEIGEGNYDRTIDIYALGALLYEMLTGQVPFYGSSPAEVLMKHLTTQVSLEGIGEPFQSAIRKAMAKNPADRYQTVKELVDAVFASEQVRTAVSQVSTASLTQVGQRTAQYIGATPGQFNSPGRHATPPVDSSGQAQNRRDEMGAHASQRFYRAGQRLRQAAGRLGGNCSTTFTGDLLIDPLPGITRVYMASMAILLAATIAAFSAAPRNSALDFFFCILAIVGSLVGVNTASSFLGSGFRGESAWVRRLILGAPAALGAAILSIPFWAGRNNFPGTFEACFGAMLLMQWDKRVSPARMERVTIGHLLCAGLLAFILGTILDDRHPVTAIATVMGASAAASLFSAWGRSPAGIPVPTPPIPPATRATTANRPTPPPLPSRAPVENLFSTEFNPGAQPNVRPGLRAARSPWRFAWLFPLFLLVSALGSASHNQKPEKLVLLAVTAAVLFHIFKPTRGGIMSNASPYAPTGIMHQGSSVGGFAASVGRGVAGLIGSVLLTASLILAFAVAVRIPELLDSGALNPRMPTELAQQFGDPQWPRLMLEIGTAACVVTSVASLVFLLLARRRGGPLHLVRTILGVVVLLVAAIQLGRQLPDLSSLSPAPNVSQLLDLYLQQVQLNVLLRAAVNFTLGAILLGWPARGPRPVAISPPSVHPAGPTDAVQKPA